MSSTTAVKGVTKANTEKYPSQIKYIVGNEACERYSYYGMTSILTVFLTGSLLMQDSVATETYHNFKAACYFTPLIGAFIADKFWGKYKTILMLSVLYCVGHAYLAIFEHTPVGFMTGLALIAIGAGGIKPCVSAHVGDQFKKGQEGMLRRIFELFYFMINFGSLFATLVTPWTYKHYGAAVAFGIPGILMALATFIFWMGRNEFVHVPAQEEAPAGFNAGFWIAIIGFCLVPFTYASMGAMSYYIPSVIMLGVWAYGFFMSKEQNSFPTVLFNLVTKGEEAATKKHGADVVDGTRAVLSIIGVFSMITFFWALFDQHGSTWILQGREMDQNFMGMTILPSQMAGLNPFLVMTLIPIFSYAIYPALNKVMDLTPLKKVTIGMFITGFSFVVVALVQRQLDAGNQLSILWQSAGYIIITAAEVMVSITCLEFAYTQAPRSMKSTVMSMFFLTVFFGNIFAGKVASFGEVIKTHAIETMGMSASKEFIIFMFFAAVMFVAAGIFALIAKNYKMRDYMES